MSLSAAPGHGRDRPITSPIAEHAPDLAEAQTAYDSADTTLLRAKTALMEALGRSAPAGHLADPEGLRVARTYALVSVAESLAVIARSLRSLDENGVRSEQL